MGSQSALKIISHNTPSEEQVEEDYTGEWTTVMKKVAVRKDRKTTTKKSTRGMGSPPKKIVNMRSAATAARFCMSLVANQKPENKMLKARKQRAARGKRGSAGKPEVVAVKSARFSEALTRADSEPARVPLWQMKMKAKAKRVKRMMNKQFVPRDPSMVVGASRFDIKDKQAKPVASNRLSQDSKSEQ